jgi:hypothetical protein
VGLRLLRSLTLGIFVFDLNNKSPSVSFQCGATFSRNRPLKAAPRPAHTYHGRAPAPIGPQLPPRLHTATLVALSRPLLPAPRPFVDLFEGFQTSHQAFIAARRGGTSRAPCV